MFQGRCPHYLEPAVIIVLTDGGKLTGSAGVQQEVKYNDGYLLKNLTHVFGHLIGLLGTLST